MDQKSGQLEKSDEQGLGKTGVADQGLKPRPATSVDVKRSEEIVVSDLKKIENTDGMTEDTEQIKEQIEQTRSQMTETINAIEEKLSFANISGQVSEQINNAVVTAKDAVFDATLRQAEKIMKNVSKGFNEVYESVGEAGTYVARSARQNPLPLALIGLGVGMLLIQGTRSSSNRKSTGGRKLSKYNDENQDASMFKNLAGTGSDVLNSAQKKVSDVAGTAYDGVSSAASTAYDGVTNVASSAYEGVTSAASSAYQGVSSFAGSTGEQVQNVARKAQDQYEHTLEENPLAIGAVALAVGAVVGLSIPITSYENQFMGETKDNLFQTAEEAAREAFSKVQESAGEFISTAREQAKGQANG